VNGGEQLFRKARKAFENELAGDGQVRVSANTAWEIAMRVSKGRLALTMGIDDWLEAVASMEGASFPHRSQSP